MEPAPTSVLPRTSSRRRLIAAAILFVAVALTVVGRQVYAFHLGEDDFVHQLAPARTFVFETEVQELRNRGFGKHLTPKEFLVIAPGGPVPHLASAEHPIRPARSRPLEAP